MNWRLLTAINAAIALITLSAAIYIMSRPSGERAHTTSVRSVQTNEQKQAADREAKARVEALTDFSEARVDDLGAVPAVELTHLMDRATPEQLAALALKFNDAPIDARTFGGMGVFFQAWTQLDPQAALTGAFQLRDVTMRKLAATSVVNSVSPSSAPQLIAQLAEHPDKDLEFECKNEFLEPLVGNWANLDPEAAAQYVDSLQDSGSSISYSARQKIGYAWGSLDPKAALDWVAKHGKSESYDSRTMYDQVMRGWCLNDIGAASAYIAQHLDDPGASFAADTVAAAMFGSDIERATNWVSSLPRGEARDSSERMIANIWSSKDPPAAAKWLATLPENEQQDYSYRIAENWIGKNWSDAWQWIQTLTGDVRDNAVRAAVNREGATDAESLSLALSIRNPEMQNSAIEDTIRSWTYRDAQAAETWVKNSPLSQEQQQHLFSVISEAKTAATEAESERVITN